MPEFSISAYSKLKHGTHEKHGRWTIDSIPSVTSCVRRHALSAEVRSGPIVTHLPPNPPDRFGTHEAEIRLNSILGFEHDPFEQDWKIERSDGTRLNDFVDIYTSHELTEDEQFMLMGLIVASAHDALDFHGLTSKEWQVVHDLLLANTQLHASTIYYWCCADAKCADECFTLTPLMRRVWLNAFPNKPDFPTVPKSG